MKIDEKFRAGAAVLHATAGENDNVVAIEGHCVFTGKPHQVVVPKDGYLKWRQTGAYIQDALPLEPADVREFLISGVSPEGWEQTFGKEE